MAEQLRISRRRVRQLIDEGKLPAERFGRYWRLRKDQVDVVINARIERC